MPRIPKLPKLTTPFEPLREIIRGGRERLEKAGGDIRSIAEDLNPLRAPETQNEAPSEEKPMATTKTAVESGTACTLCSDEHLSEVSGALGEALRFARSEGLGSREVVRRVRHARDELNAMERFDLAPEEIAKLPEEEKEVAHWALPQSRDLRHLINAMRSVDDLEKVAGQAANVADEFGERLIKCKPGYFETKPEASELPPEIEALRGMVEKRKGR